MLCNVILCYVCMCVCIYIHNWRWSPSATVDDWQTGTEDTLRSMSNLAVLLERSDRIEEALKLYQQVQAGTSKVFGLVHPKTLESTLALGVCLAEAGRSNEAEAVMQGLYSELEAQGFSPDHECLGFFFFPQSTATFWGSKFGHSCSFGGFSWICPISNHYHGLTDFPLSKTIIPINQPTIDFQRLLGTFHQYHIPLWVEWTILFPLTIINHHYITIIKHHQSSWSIIKHH